MSEGDDKTVSDPPERKEVLGKDEPASQDSTTPAVVTQSPGENLDDPLPSKDECIESHADSKSDDKREIADEEREKMIADEKRVPEEDEEDEVKRIKGSEVEKKKKALEEAALEPAKRRVPIGGIKIPGFLRPKSRDKNKGSSEEFLLFDFNQEEQKSSAEVSNENELESLENDLQYFPANSNEVIDSNKESSTTESSVYVDCSAQEQTSNKELDELSLNNHTFYLMDDNLKEEEAEMAAHDNEIMERLISLVKERPLLWDSKVVLLPKDVSVKTKMWVEVARQMEMSVRDCKSKFKSLKDRFWILHQRPQAITTPIKWAHYESLTFLYEDGHAILQKTIPANQIKKTRDVACKSTKPKANQIGNVSFAAKRKSALSARPSSKVAIDHQERRTIPSSATTKVRQITSCSPPHSCQGQHCQKRMVFALDRAPSRDRGASLKPRTLSTTPKCSQSNKNQYNQRSNTIQFRQTVRTNATDARILGQRASSAFQCKTLQHQQQHQSEDEMQQSLHSKRLELASICHKLSQTTLQQNSCAIGPNHFHNKPDDCSSHHTQLTGNSDGDTTNGLASVSTGTSHNKRYSDNLDSGSSRQDVCDMFDGINMGMSDTSSFQYRLPLISPDDCSYFAYMVQNYLRLVSVPERIQTMTEIMRLILNKFDK